MRFWVEEEIMEKLIEEAKKYDADEMQLFIDELGWQDWMNDFTEAEDGEEITEEESNRIDRVLEDAFKHAMKRKYMERWQVGDMYELNGISVIITEVTEDMVYCAEVEIDEDGEPHPMEGTANALTPYELKNLK